MDTDAQAIRDRLDVVYVDEAISVGEEDVWYAEDPETGCVGLGDVEPEAVGNAIAVVARYEREVEDGRPYVKVPGRVVRKSWDADRSDGLLDFVRELL